MWLYLGPRQSGKTHRMLEWLAAAQPAPGYPGWDRVLVVPTLKRKHDLIRRFRDDHGFDPDNPGNSDTDLHHRIYALGEWRGAMNVLPMTQVGFDDIDAILLEVLNHRGNLTLASLTGAALDPSPAGDDPPETFPWASGPADRDG